MEGTASTTRPRTVGDPPADGLREWLQTRYEHTYARSPQRKQLDYLEVVMRWLAHAETRNGDDVLRSYEQIVGALGLPLRETSRATRQRWRTQIRNTLGYLGGMGLVDAPETVYEPNGEGRGILLRLPAGVAQLVRPELYRAGRRPGSARVFPHATTGRRSFSGQFATPLREQRAVVAVSPRTVLFREDGAQLNSGASAHARTRTRAEHHRCGEQRERALAVLAALDQHHEDGWFGALEAHPWLAQLDPYDLARAALQARCVPRVWPGISAKWTRKLRAACRRIDRFAAGGRGMAGAWVEQLLLIIAGDWREWLSEPPRSLGAYAVCLRRVANRWRLAGRRNRGCDVTVSERRQRLSERWRHIRRLELDALEDRIDCRREPAAGRESQGRMVEVSFKRVAPRGRSVDHKRRLRAEPASAPPADPEGRARALAREWLRASAAPAPATSDVASRRSPDGERDG